VSLTDEGVERFVEAEANKTQPRPQGFLGFQYGGGSGEDPGTQQIT